MHELELDPKAKVRTVRLYIPNTPVHAIVANGWTRDEITACRLMMGHSYSLREERPGAQVDCAKCRAEIASGRERPIYTDGPPEPALAAARAAPPDRPAGRTPRAERPPAARQAEKRPEPKRPRAQDPPPQGSLF